MHTQDDNGLVVNMPILYKNKSYTLFRFYYIFVTFCHSCIYYCKLYYISDYYLKITYKYFMENEIGY